MVNKPIPHYLPFSPPNCVHHLSTNPICCHPPTPGWCHLSPPTPECRHVSSPIPKCCHVFPSTQSAATPFHPPQGFQDVVSSRSSSYHTRSTPSVENPAPLVSQPLLLQITPLLTVPYLLHQIHQFTLVPPPVHLMLPIIPQLCLLNLITRPLILTIFLVMRTYHLFFMRYYQNTYSYISRH